MFSLLKIGHFFCPFLDFGITFDPFLFEISALTENIKTKIILPKICMIVNNKPKIQTTNGQHKPKKIR